MADTNPTSLAKRRYVITLVWCMAAYIAVLVPAIWLLSHGIVIGPLRYAVAIAPAVPILFVWLTILRYWSTTDELERRQMLESLGVAGAITALLAATYGFLEGAGLPHPSAWWTWTVFMASWLVGRLIVNRFYE